MASESSFRHWRPLEYRAKFEAHRKTSEENLREELNSAKQQQQTLRASPSWHSGSTTTKEDRSPVAKHSIHSLIRHQSKKLRRSWLSSESSSNIDISNTQDVKLDLQNSTTGSPEATPHPSVVQSPSDPYDGAIEAWFPSDKLQPMPMVKLARRPAKKEARRKDKEARQQEKEDKKAQKQVEKDERNELRRRITEARIRDKAHRLGSSDIDAAVGVDGFSLKGLKATPAHGWRRPLLGLSTHSRRSKRLIPMPGDFSSKADLRAYLNPVPDTPYIPEIPELPADPPPYKPLEASLPNPNQQDSYQLDNSAPPQAPLQDNARLRTAEYGFGNGVEASSRQMLCDLCSFPIRVSEKYLQCDMCPGGDRIVCMSCSNAGLRCRHKNLTERTSSVKRETCDSSSSAYARGGEQSLTLPPADFSASRMTRSSSTQKETVTPRGDEEYAEANATIERFEAFQRVEALFRDEQTRVQRESAQSFEDIQQQQVRIRHMEEIARQREEELRYREREIVLREREATIRDRESALREQQAALREREAASHEQRVVEQRKVQANSPKVENLDAAINCERRIKTERAISSSAGTGDRQPFIVQESCVNDSNEENPVPARKRSLSANLESCTLKGKVPKPSSAVHTSYSTFEEELASAIRHRATQLPSQRLAYLQETETRGRGQAAGAKRKASASTAATVAPASKSNAPQQSFKGYAYDLSNRNDHDEDTDEEGTSKRRKPSSPLPNGPQRLLACPYAKCDPIRFSEKNQQEKQYRGCSGRYLTDISRLKQHLYRVHKRPDHHCPRCFEVFKSKNELDSHARRRVLCDVAECPFEEKFDESCMKELKRKRPGKSVEDAWYAIWNILFPDRNPPESPYIDDVPTQGSMNCNSGTDEQTTNLLDIFNEQLSQHQNAASHSWLGSRDARELINQTLAQSMAEMLRRISPSNTPSIGRTPSIFISPTSAQPRSTFQTPASSVPASPVSAEPSSSPRRNVPWLSPLQTRLHKRQNSIEEVLPSGESPSVETSQETIKQSPSVRDPPINQDLSPELELPDIENFEQLLGNDSFGFGDNIGLAISDVNNTFDFDFPTSNLQDDVPGNHSFVPVKVSSLNDVATSSQPTGSSRPLTTLKTTSSKRSLDSGYGSMGIHSRANSGRENNFGVNGGSAPQDQVHVAEGDLAFLESGLYETLDQGSGYSYDVAYY